MAVYTSGFSNTSYMYLRATATESEVSTANNTSKVTVKVELVSQSGGYPWASDVKYPLLVQINGVTVHNANHSYSVPKGGSQVLGTYSYTVPHNSDGSKSCAIYVKFVANSTHGSSSLSKTLTLTAIARASTPTLSTASQALGYSLIIYTNKKASFTHSIEVYFGGWSATVARGVTDSFSWELPYDLAHQIPKSASGKGIIRLVTYNGANQIGYKDIEFTATVPNTAMFKPSFSSINHSEAVADIANRVGVYVQSLSKLNLSISGASGAYGSSIVSYYLNFGGSSYSSGKVTTEEILWSGDMSITAKVTDSRGREYTDTVVVKVLPYSTPKLETVTVERCNSDGTPNLIGTYAKVVVKASASSLLVNSVEKNIKTVTVDFKQRISPDYISLGQSTFNGGLDTAYIYAGFDIAKSYDIRVTWGDQFKSYDRVRFVSTGAVPGSFGKSGFGAGKVWEKGGLDVGGMAYFDEGIEVEGISRFKDEVILSNFGYKVGENGGSCSVEAVFNVQSKSSSYFSQVCVIDVADYSGGCAEIYFSGVQLGIAAFSGVKKVLFGKNVGEDIYFKIITNEYLPQLNNQNDSIILQSINDNRIGIYITSQNELNAIYSITVKLTGSGIALL